MLWILVVDSCVDSYLSECCEFLLCGLIVVILRVSIVMEMILAGEVSNHCIGILAGEVSNHCIRVLAGEVSRVLEYWPERSVKYRNIDRRGQ